MRKVFPELPFVSSLSSLLDLLASFSWRFRVLMVLEYPAHTSSRLSQPASMTSCSGSFSVGALRITFTFACPFRAV